MPARPGAPFARIPPLTLALLAATPARAQREVGVSLADALSAAERAAPDLLVARAQESVARADVAVAGLYPNPSVSGATSTQAAKVAATISIPLVILGQRGAGLAAARAEEATTALDTQVAWNDVRQATTRAFDGLWLAERKAAARRESAAIQAALESTVVQRVQLGSAPEIDGLRAHAEKLRADADVLAAEAAVAAAASELGRWMGATGGPPLRTTGDLVAPEAPPPLADLLARVESSAPVRRERSAVRAAEARAAHERALVRPAMSLDLGVDAYDPTLPATNYRAQLTVDVPLFHQRGAYVDRERALADVARARARASRVRLAAELVAAYRDFEAATARTRTLAGAVVPAAQGAARATEDAYALGRAPLVAVLDAERTSVETRVSALEAQAERAAAWADVEHAVGAP